MAREIILDIETTGLFLDEGERVISVGMVEMIDSKETGTKLYFFVNPERESKPEALQVHKLTTEFLSKFPTFGTYAEVIREFIGDDPVIITCRTEEKNGKPYVLDKEFLNAELVFAGVEPVKDAQWINVRKWSEEMFGSNQATLNKILDRYGISRSERDEKGHGALLDAELLAAAYPRLLEDYIKFIDKTKVSKPVSKIANIKL